ncbi:hypothetical protein SSX86_003574 [Deinandra increscens subsp. villosa]|uniref:Cytochrome b5 heme-binding domain-containing protein n=1 Tax=Deinandra increscens subsp. villosa TaxID=3103831 RepID=A0AAP0H559_9ASTR
MEASKQRFNLHVSYFPATWRPQRNGSISTFRIIKPHGGLNATPNSFHGLLPAFVRITPFISIILAGTFMASQQKTFVFEDVAKHEKLDDCWVIISGKVYDVTPFMEEHPGGSEVVLAATGKDATTDFEETGHSDEAKQLMSKYYVGNVDQSTVPLKRLYKLSTKTETHDSDPTRELMVKILKFLVPLIIVVFAFRALK